MSGTSEPEEPARAETFPVTIDAPTAPPARHDAEVERGIHEGRGITILHGLVDSQRHHKGSYGTLRVSLWRPDDPRPDAPADGSGAERALTAADAMLDAETDEPDAGELSDEDDQL